MIDHRYLQPHNDIVRNITVQYIRLSSRICYGVVIFIFCNVVWLVHSHVWTSFWRRGSSRHATWGIPMCLSKPRYLTLPALLRWRLHPHFSNSQHSPMTWHKVACEVQYGPACRQNIHCVWLGLFWTYKFIHISKHRDYSTFGGRHSGLRETALGLPRNNIMGCAG